LAAGEAGFRYNPSNIADAGVDAIRKGVTRYTAVDGTAELKERDQSASFKNATMRWTYDRAQILVSSGVPSRTCFNGLRGRFFDIRAMNA